MSGRLLALVTDAYGGRGGIAQYNRDLFGALGAAGTNRITVLPRFAGEPVSPPLGVKQLPAQGARAAYVLRALLLTLTGRFDIVFCGHIHMAPLAAMLARLRGAKLIVQMHGIEAWQRPSGLYRWAVESADLVACVSRYTRSAVLDWAALAPERVIVLPNTVAEIYTPGSRADGRKKFGFDDQIILLTVGRLSAMERYKGHDRVIEAIPALVASGHDVLYLIVGDGDDRGRLEKLADRVGVSGRVRFTGLLEGDRLIAAYRMADLFVMPSTGEGFGIAYLEAMACGTPAVGLAAGGAPDALADGELGTMTSPPELAATLAALLQKPKPNAAELSAAVRRRFGREVFASGARSMLERIAA